MSAWTRYAPDGVEYVGGIRYRLTAALIWRIGNQFGPVYRVPKGFEFEVSVPRLLRWIVSPHDHRFLKAAALHDHMLETGLMGDEMRMIMADCDDELCKDDGRAVARAEEVRWSREEAAGSFAAALKADGASYLMRLAAHLGVVLWTTR